MERHNHHFEDREDGLDNLQFIISFYFEAIHSPDTGKKSRLEYADFINKFIRECHHYRIHIKTSEQNQRKIIDKTGISINNMHLVGIDNVSSPDDSVLDMEEEGPIPSSVRILLSEIIDDFEIVPVIRPEHMNYMKLADKSFTRPYN